MWIICMHVLYAAVYDSITLCLIAFVVVHVHVYS